MPYIYQLTTDSDPKVAEQAKLALSRKTCKIEDFRDWSYAKARALEILEPFQAEEEAAVRNLLKEMTGLELESGEIQKKYCHYIPRMVDGTRFIRFKFDAEEAEALEAQLKEENWMPLPISSTLQDLFFAREDTLFQELRGSYIYNTELEGYYFFRNLHPAAKNPADVMNSVVDGYCRLFFCYYTAENHSLYIFECDRPLMPEAEEAA